MRVHVVEQRGDLPIHAQRDIHRLLTVWPEAMPDVIVRRKTDGEQIGIRVCAELFVFDGLFGERKQQVVSKRRVVERLVESLAGRGQSARNDVRKTDRV